MKNKNQSITVVIAVAAALIAVLLLDTWQVFRLTSKLTRSSGQYHLESISGALESTVSDAGKLAMEVGLAAYPHLDEHDDLDRFIHTKKAEVIARENGCFNVYIAGTGWAIIPDFDMPEDYIATERDWYRGAKRSQGTPYVTAPYADAMTGEICYTVSVLLGDGDTVVGLDYTMDTIQSHIVRMYESGSELALIVTGDGIIAGCSDETMIGKKLSEELPEYCSIFSLAKSRQGFVTSRIRSDVLYENLFATSSGFGWYLIVSESDWSLYRDSYLQLMLTAAIALLLLLVIVIFFVITVRREQASRNLVREKNRLLENLANQMTAPLYALLETGGQEKPSGEDTVSPDKAPVAHAEEMVKARTAARQILEVLRDAKPVREQPEERKDGTTREKNVTLHMNSRFRFRILMLILLVILISFLSNLWVSLRWGSERLRSEVSVYDYTLTEWVGQQKSILDMFCSVISTNPGMLDDYDGTVAYLNRITQQYPEISVTYMTNPDRNPTVYMNNGWLPPEGWLVEERQWYIDTEASETGWSISAPYYDEQTGLYCVTFAERVYDAETGAYLGTFGIDFFMDKLIGILGGSYSDTGYAFLADTDGVIINHPYGSYQMTENNSANVSELSYGQLKVDGHSSITIRDYDGTLRVLIACRNEQSHFVIYEAVSFFSVYAPLVLSEGLILALLITCAVMVFRLLSALMKWQDNMNERMQEAADTAIAAGRAKSRFLAQMSHEIRTPINAVLGMNEMILRESRDEEILDYASNIQTAGRTLLSLINSILDFSKIEEGKMEIIPVEYDTASFINNLVASISERAKDKGLTLSVEVDENLPSRLCGDDVRLSQVVMNILTNAVKYTEKGEVRFSVAGGERRDDSIELKIAVRDTGIGIREEDLPRLFESFERLDEVRNHNIEGTGLGMSIVTRLLAMMDSRLQVESVYGEGSTFSFIVLQQVKSDKPIGNYTGRLEASHRSGGGESLLAEDARILVVDDNEMNLKVARNLLKLFGIVPDLAYSGFEAIEYVRRKEYHIIFLDHMMPKMDGIETLAELRKEELLKPGTAVIALTANAVNGAKEQYLAAGFTSYLSKPIDVRHLEEQLLHYLPREICSLREPDSPAEEASPSADPSPDAAETVFLEKLGALGCDTGAGLRYAAGDPAFYLDLVRNFSDGAAQASTAIRQAFEAKNIRDYQIRVHSLKSSARQIGANALADLAQAQETAAKNGDGGTVSAGAEELLSRYESAARELKAVLADIGDDGKNEGLCPTPALRIIHAEEAAAVLREAAADIDNFEAERAAEILRGLMDTAVGTLSLAEPVSGILQALGDFDTFTAGEKAAALLSEITEREVPET
ncbi:MAG: response regulator [Oscillospiraceae bacterium]|nr:response regulator [Oscillospiraceae bacterium]